MKPNKAVILLMLFLIFIMGIILVVRLANQPAVPTPTPTAIPIFSPAPGTVVIPEKSPAYNYDAKDLGEPATGRSYQVITDQDKAQMVQDEAVGKLIPKLPYEGSDFSLSYDFSNNVFSATVKGDSGEQEFEKFLKDNKIADKNWLYNLTVSTINE